MELICGDYNKKVKYMHKILICGHFGGNEEFLDGQTIKTKNIYLALLDKYGEKEINKIDTYQWKKHPISFLKKCIDGSKDSKNIIILPAQNGVRVFIPLFLLINKLYKRKIFYIVVGGWLPEFLENRKGLLKKVKKLDKIFVETNNMKKKLEKIEVKNVEILVNFKSITPLKEELVFNYSKPYKLCTFSRVMKEKGIEDAIQVVKNINEEFNETIYELDIYGQIDKSYKDTFTEVINNSPKYVQYKGCINSEKSVETLKNYYLLLFPTKFKTEGIPGTIIDALSAGVPIIASRWDNADEIICDGKNGLIYEFNDLVDFYNKLKMILDYKKVYNMKYNCIEDAKRFTTECAMEKIYTNLKE